MSHQTPGITHLFPNTQIMQFKCDDIWRRVDQLDFRFGDELTRPPRRRDDQGNELTCNPGERFASHGDIFDCRGSSLLVDCIFVLVRI